MQVAHQTYRNMIYGNYKVQNIIHRGRSAALTNYRQYFEAEQLNFFI